MKFEQDNAVGISVLYTFTSNFGLLCMVWRIIFSKRDLIHRIDLSEFTTITTVDYTNADRILSMNKYLTAIKYFIAL